MAWALGIDLGGTKIAAGLVNGAGELRCAESAPTPARAGAAAILRTVAELGQRVCQRGAAEGLTVSCVGVGAAGQIEYPNGRVHYASATLSDWAGTEIARELGPAFGLPVVVDNDVNALALGEHRLGAGQGLATLLFVAAGTGIGGALVINGAIWRGRTHSAGEIAHLLVDYDGARLCNCGQPGHLEAYAAGPALAAQYREQAGLGEAVDLRGVAERARGGDPLARHVITEGAAILGRALSGLLNTFDPEALIVGGGVTELGDDWWGPFTSALRANPLPGPAQVVVRRAALGVLAGVMGAGVLAHDQFAPR